MNFIVIYSLERDWCPQPEKETVQENHSMARQYSYEISLVSGKDREHIKERILPLKIGSHFYGKVIIAIVLP